MSKQRRTISPEFKQQAACLVLDQGYSYMEASRSVGVGETVLRRWVQQLQMERQGVTPQGKAITPDQQRIQELEARIERLEREKAILKNGYRALDVGRHRTYEVIDQIGASESVELICAVFDVSRSCLYAHRGRARRVDAERMALRSRADETKRSAVQFLRDAVGWYAGLGVRVHRLLTDNGSAFRSHEFARACQEMGIRHKFTRAYRPQTNGKAERFIQSALREWAYAWTYQSSAHRIEALASWQHHYNWHRAHSAIGGVAPMARFPASRNNLLTLHKTSTASRCCVSCIAVCAE